MTDKEVFDGLVAAFRTKVPGYQVQFKDESRLMRVLSTLLFFNPKFATDYITTVFGISYFPSRAWLEANYASAWDVLTHEFVHACDDQQNPVPFRLGYLFPQLPWGLLGLLGFLGFAWAPLFSLFALLPLLAPIPAYWRMRDELRGYAMTIAITYWRTGAVPDGMLSWARAQFVGSGYYFMWPFERDMDARLVAVFTAVTSGTILTGPGSMPYAFVRQTLLQLGVIQESARA